jgi:hypothetical protein
MAKSSKSTKQSPFKSAVGHAAKHGIEKELMLRTAARIAINFFIFSPSKKLLLFLCAPLPLGDVPICNLRFDVHFFSSQSPKNNRAILIMLYLPVMVKKNRDEISSIRLTK